ncbi:MAG: kinase-like domain-containing protein, partial [Olpidium bornovanus]
PANVFIDTYGRLKIGDFGLATTWPAALDVEREGDRQYLAPEVLGGTYDKPGDVFSLGLIALEMAANIILPENGPAWQKLRAGDLSDCDLPPDLISQSMVDLIRAMVDPDPARRPTIANLLSHPLIAPEVAEALRDTDEEPAGALSAGKDTPGTHTLWPYGTVPPPLPGLEYLDGSMVGPGIPAYGAAGRARDDAGPDEHLLLAAHDGGAGNVSASSSDGSVFVASSSPTTSSFTSDEAVDEEEEEDDDDDYDDGDVGEEEVLVAGSGQAADCIPVLSVPDPSDPGPEAPREGGQENEDEPMQTDE